MNAPPDQTQKMAGSLPIGSLCLGEGRATNGSAAPKSLSTNGSSSLNNGACEAANGSAAPKSLSTNGSSSLKNGACEAANGSAASKSLLTNGSSSLNNGAGEAAANGIAPYKEEDQPRVGYIDWDEYFMAVSFLSAQRSKDPATQVHPL